MKAAKAGSLIPIITFGHNSLSLLTNKEKHKLLGFDNMKLSSDVK